MCFFDREALLDFFNSWIYIYMEVYFLLNHVIFYSVIHDTSEKVKEAAAAGINL